MHSDERRKDSLRALLDSQKLAALATHKEGQPYGSLVSFVSTEDMKQIVFATTRATRKYENLTADPRVAMLIDNRSNQASDIGELPATAPDGRPWSELAKEDLEAVMLEQATAARQAITEAVEAGTLRGPPRLEIQAKIDPRRAWFIAAGLEYALRGYGIREAAFFGGYAPMVFRAREWRLPRPPDPPVEPDPEYDLVVVGAGLSGLVAAHFFLQQHPDARILLLDNHDDFGGHAKRNEFAFGDSRILGYGGSQSLQEPSSTISSF